MEVALEQSRVQRRENTTSRPRSIERAKIADMESTESAKFGNEKRRKLCLLQADHTALTAPDEGFDSRTLIPAVQAPHVPRQEFEGSVPGHEDGKAQEEARGRQLGPEPPLSQLRRKCPGALGQLPRAASPHRDPASYLNMRKFLQE